MTRIFFVAAGLSALAACNSSPVENASRNISRSADNVADDFQSAARNAGAAAANEAADMSNGIDNATSSLQNRADRVGDAARNSARDLGNAVSGR